MKKLFIGSIAMLVAAFGAIIAPVSSASAAPHGAPAPCNIQYKNGKKTGLYFCNFYVAGGSPVSATPKVHNPFTQQNVGYLKKGTHWVKCQAQAWVVSHGKYYNTWWAYTQADNGKWGWVNAVYASGGGNHGKFANVPLCSNGAR